MVSRCVIQNKSLENLPEIRCPIRCNYSEPCSALTTKCASGDEACHSSLRQKMTSNEDAKQFKKKHACPMWTPPKRRTIGAHFIQKCIHFDCAKLGPMNILASKKIILKKGIQNTEIRVLTYNVNIFTILLNMKSRSKTVIHEKDTSFI